MLTAFKIIFLLGFLVFIHELGHYLVAKRCKVQVNQFALGFGPVIWHKKKNETDYELRLIPLGGFVNLEGEEEHSEKEGSFNKATIAKRIAIIAAGALVNIIFGVLVYFILITIRHNIVVENNLLASIKYGLGAVVELMKSIFWGLGQLVTGKLNINDMVGPVGISSMVSQTNGIVEFIYLLALISISLGVTNLLPIIPLDGGKIVLLIIEKIRKKPIKRELELEIQTVGFFALIAFSIIVTYNDIAKLFH